MSYVQKIDFSCSIEVLGHFQNLPKSGNFFEFFWKYFFCILKIDIHNNFHTNMSRIECVIAKKTLAHKLNPLAVYIYIYIYTYIYI